MKHTIGLLGGPYQYVDQQSKQNPLLELAVDAAREMTVTERIAVIEVRNLFIMSSKYLRCAFKQTNYIQLADIVNIFAD